jgi:hypothetical protein
MLELFILCVVYLAVKDSFPNGWKDDSDLFE